MIGGNPAPDLDPDPDLSRTDQDQEQDREQEKKTRAIIGPPRPIQSLPPLCVCHLTADANL
jgi:hypothetical protein